MKGCFAIVFALGVFLCPTVTAIAGEGASAPSEGLSYSDMFEKLLADDLGPVVSKACYDPATLPAVVSSFNDEGASLLGPVTEAWTNFENGHPPVSLSIQATTPHRLVLLKRTTSIGIGRIHRDAVLHALYAGAKTSAERMVVRRHVRRAVRALVNHFFIGLQVIIDVTLEDHPFRRKLEHQQQWHDFDVDTDPLLLMTAAIKHTDEGEQIDALEQRIQRGDFLKELIPSTKTSDRAFVRSQILEYKRAHVNRAFPGNGKFWNFFRPTSGCSSLTRTCEEPEACRLVCNIEYLIGAGTTKTFHRFIGFGSNNDFGWEESTVRLFSARGAASSTAPFNSIRSLTTLDCTVANWQIPEYMKKQNNFMTGRICIDQAPTPPEGRIRIESLKRIVLDGEGNVNGSKLERQGVKVDVPPPTVEQKALFDDVAIFKVDVEGHEHSTIPVWAKLELQDLKRTKGDALKKELAARAKKESTVPLTVIDFERDVPSFFTVSMFQLELHAYVDHKRPFFDAPAIQAFRMQQYLASLGFIGIAQERNAFGDCCYEFVYAHYRYLVRSELWNTLRL